MNLNYWLKQDLFIVFTYKLNSIVIIVKVQI